MFIDIAKIYIKAGNGGNGAIAFHREKYIAAGGPSGGDGGRGGDVVFCVDPGIWTLMDFRYKRKYVAGTGEDGKGTKSNGKDGEDIIINVPSGTIIREAQTNRILADMTKPGERVVIAKGGNGGWGNAKFATPTRQTPNFAKNGQKGQEFEVVLELRMLSDVGLVGFPNVGKSTLLSKTTSAKPKIANYHFTTLTPNLGIVDLGGGRSFAMADIPGIIEGASEGVGLGHDFLRHIERTRLLLHLIDVSGVEGRNPIEDFDTINSELEKYNPQLAKRMQVVVANKTDIITDGEMYKNFVDEIKSRGYTLFEISAATGKGVAELMNYTYEQLVKLPPMPVYEPEPEILPENYTSPEDFVITKDGDVYVVEGPWIEAVGGSINFADEESLQYFQRALRKKGVIEALEAQGINEGDIVRMGDLEFEFVR